MTGRAMRLAYPNNGRGENTKTHDGHEERPAPNRGARGTAEAVASCRRLFQAGLRNRISRRLFCSKNESETCRPANSLMMSRFNRIVCRPRVAG